MLIAKERILFIARNFEKNNISTGNQSIDVTNKPTAPHFFLYNKAKIVINSMIDSMININAKISVREKEAILT